MSGNDKVFLYRPQGDYPPRTRLGVLEVGRVHEVTANRAEPHLQKFAVLTPADAETVRKAQKDPKDTVLAKELRTVDARAAKQIAEKAAAREKQVAEKLAARSDAPSTPPKEVATTTPTEESKAPSAGDQLATNSAKGGA